MYQYMFNCLYVCQHDMYMYMYVCTCTTLYIDQNLQQLAARLVQDAHIQPTNGMVCIEEHSTYVSLQ